MFWITIKHLEIDIMHQNRTIKTKQKKQQTFQNFLV